MQTAMLDTQMWWLPTADTARGRASPTTRRASSGPDSRTTRAPLGRTMIPGAVTLPTFYCGSSEHAREEKKKEIGEPTLLHTPRTYTSKERNTSNTPGVITCSDGHKQSTSRLARPERSHLRERPALRISNFERKFSDLMTRSNFCHCGSVVFCFASMRFEVAGSIPL